MKLIDVLSEYHIMPQFPPNVVRETENLPTEVNDND